MIRIREPSNTNIFEKMKSFATTPSITSKSPDFKEVIKDEIWVVDNFLTEDECKELITSSEKLGYELAVFRTGANGEGTPDLSFRDTKRLFNDDPALAAYLYEKCVKIMPLAYEGGKMTRVNERFRFLKYDHPGAKFGRHVDGQHLHSETQRSMITLHIYLNEGFSGGETTFFHNYFKDMKFSVVPKTGMCLFFRQDGWIHEGSVMGKGVKYTIRSDLMYTYPTIQEIDQVKHENCGLCGGKTRFVELDPCSHQLLVCKCAPFNRHAFKRFNCVYCMKEIKYPNVLEAKEVTL